MVPIDTPKNAPAQPPAPEIPTEKEHPQETAGSINKINIQGTTVTTADVIIGNKTTTSTNSQPVTGSGLKNTTQDNSSSRTKNANTNPKSSWANGLFYLFVFVVVVAVVGFFASQLNLATLAVIILAGMIAVLLVGVLQLRMMNKITDKSFLQLIKIVVKQLPLIGGAK